MRNTIKHDNISDTSNHTYINGEIVHSSVSNEIDLDNKEEDLEGEDNVIDEDQEILISLLEVVVILMEGFRTQFDETLKEKLLSEVSDILPDLVEYFEVSIPIYITSTLQVVHGLMCTYVYIYIYTCTI